VAERSISEILEALARIETNLKTIAENGADHEERLRALESRNGKRFEALTLSVLTAAAVGIVGFVLGKLF